MLQCAYASTANNHIRTKHNSTMHSIIALPAGLGLGAATAHCTAHCWQRQPHKRARGYNVYVQASHSMCQRAISSSHEILQKADKAAVNYLSKGRLC
jgi:hypothetical protein